LTESGAEILTRHALVRSDINQRGLGIDGHPRGPEVRLTGHEPLEVKAHSDSNKDFRRRHAKQWFNESKLNRTAAGTIWGATR